MSVVVSFDAFRADPGHAYRLAATYDRVIVNDARGRARLVISRQREPLRDRGQR